MLKNTFQHIPVLVGPAAEMLVWNPSGLYVDGTLGGGGHSAAFLSRLDPSGQVIGFDKDVDAVAASKERFKDQSGHISIMHHDFMNIEELLTGLNIGMVDGVFLDLGLSSYQIDTPERGFSFMADGPLDMRMNQTETRSASDIVNRATEEELKHILYDYGEERLARPLAKAIIKSRQKATLQTTTNLVKIIKEVVRHRPVIKTCARVFQALRIAVNNELERLKSTLGSILPLLKPEGRLGIIAYHSLEDRMIKHTFREWATNCTCPPGLPQCVCQKEAYVTILTKRPIRPIEPEILGNPRARSAKLRMVEKLPGSSLKVA